MLARFAAELKAVAVVERHPKLDGRQMTMTLAPRERVRDSNTPGCSSA